ncbi:uncharacterized protein LOC123536355 [Mercenaria mercenaria]|uniref:uncharacterized protein LOC123536355 n=1 Tax=Mercenaria mercenaria TaxID=6596 RepID=UPI00234FAC09|nr:uncharacterized protein LOC123536355 [Mercenaria mercenaria]
MADNTKSRTPHIDRAMANQEEKRKVTEGLIAQGEAQSKTANAQFEKAVRKKRHRKRLMCSCFQTQSQTENAQFEKAVRKKRRRKCLWCSCFRNYDDETDNQE